MDSIIKVASKYAVILSANALFGYTWFYIRNMVFDIRSFEDIVSIPYLISNYVGYGVQLLVGVMLLLDMRKFQVKYYLVPIAGIIYPLLGVCMLLILVLLRDVERTSA